MWADEEELEISSIPVLDAKFSGAEKEKPKQRDQKKREVKNTYPNPQLSNTSDKKIDRAVPIAVVRESKPKKLDAVVRVKPTEVTSYQKPIARPTQVPLTASEQRVPMQYRGSHTSTSHESSVKPSSSYYALDKVHSIDVAISKNFADIERKKHVSLDTRDFSTQLQKKTSKFEFERKEPQLIMDEPAVQKEVVKTVYPEHECDKSSNWRRKQPVEKVEKTIEQAKVVVKKHEHKKHHEEIGNKERCIEERGKAQQGTTNVDCVTEVEEERIENAQPFNNNQYHPLPFYPHANHQYSQPPPQYLQQYPQPPPQHISTHHPQHLPQHLPQPYPYFFHQFPPFNTFQNFGQSHNNYQQGQQPIHYNPEMQQSHFQQMASAEQYTQIQQLASGVHLEHVASNDQILEQSTSSEIQAPYNDNTQEDAKEQVPVKVITTRRGLVVKKQSK